MAMINVEASLPAPMWGVVRLLATAGPLSRQRARALLCPPCMLPDGTESPFDVAVTTLTDLGLVAVDGDDLRLAGAATGLSASDLDAFTDVLRAAVLAVERNTDLGTSSSQSGPRDLVRALTWFLTLDPLAAPLGWDEVAPRQDGAFPAEVGKPIVNDVRWRLFTYWAPALGFAAAPLLSSEDRKSRLIPDCTEAVRRIVLRRWRTDERLDAVAAINQIVEDLPVLPGGRYSQQLGLGAPPDTVSASLSLALLRGQEQGWLELDHRSDATRQVMIIDPDAARGTIRKSDLVIRGELDG
ncbi:protein DpdG [Salinispora arenicola]|uniref:protein DpdG n=1 Tax=Salinispora arenicola TaxID=168697 RepID=UPI0003813098|nr:protein DpdG [Salinispora arenicola]